MAARARPIIRASRAAINWPFRAYLGWCRFVRARQLNDPFAGRYRNALGLAIFGGVMLKSFGASYYFSAGFAVFAGVLVAVMVADVKRRQRPSSKVEGREENRE